MRLLLACALLAGVASAQGAWFEGIRVLRPGDFLDLDNGGTFPSRDSFPGGAAEMGDRAAFLVGHEEDPAFAEAAAPMSRRPWHRVRTNEGNLAWVQVLQDEPLPVVRFVTRIGGDGPPLPPPRSPFLRGGRGGMEVWFTPVPQYARYRIERRDAPDAAFAEVGTAEAPPFQDRETGEGVRYGYRVTGVTAEGHAGIPAILQGTLESRGVRSGRCTLAHQDRGFDFLLGTRVPSGGDVEIVAISPEGVNLRNAFGLFVFAADADAADPSSPFDCFASRKLPIGPGDRFLVPLRGGGVARCTLDLDTTDGKPRVALDYEAYGDAGVLPDAPCVEARREEGGVAVHVQCPEPWVVREVQVTELVSGRGPWALRLEDGAALDDAASPDEVREYVAVGLDAHGRRSPRGAARVVIPPTSARSGEFRFHYRQGYSLELQRIVPASEADVVFQTCAGGIASITLAAEGGIRSLRGVLPEHSAEAIFDAFVRAEPGELGTEGQADQRAPASNVFLLRTRGGGWAKLAIVKREDGPAGWTTAPATVRYVYNPAAPVFGEESGSPTTAQGFTFTGLE